MTGAVGVAAPTTATVVIAVEGLRKRYGTVGAVDGVSFEVRISARFFRWQ